MQSSKLRRGLGCLTDPPDARGNWHASELLGASQVTLESCDRTFLLDGKIADQGQTSSCVGHGVARAIQLRLRAGLDPQAERPSALGIYLHARGIRGDGSVREGYPDIGTTIADACEAVSVHGYCRESVWPFDAGEVTSALPWHVAQAEFDQIGLKHHRLDSEGEARCALIRLALSKGCGVAVGFEVDQAFMDLHGSAAWAGATNGGGHCMAALDWDSEALRVVNSWSKDWADSGLGRITWEAVASQARSIWIVDAAVCYSL
jgi:hypothetical protein